MKKLTLILVLSLFATFTLKANDGKYKKAMKANLSKMKAAKNQAEMQKVANQFERIASAAPKKWLPNYYVAYAYIRMTEFEKDADKKDAMLDKAEEFLATASKIATNNSEIVTLEGYLAINRLTVDPMARGQEYSNMAFMKLGKAKSLNPNNPRTYFLQGALTLNMPPAFGGGKHAACPLFKTAAKKYDSFKAKNELMPTWGKKANASMKKRGGCE